MSGAFGSSPPAAVVAAASSTPDAGVREGDDRDVALVDDVAASVATRTRAVARATTATVRISRRRPTRRWYVRQVVARFAAMDVKANAQHEVTGSGSALVELSHAVHSHPELAFEEERAAAWVADALSGPFTIDGRGVRPADGLRRDSGHGTAHDRDLRGVRRAAEHRPCLRAQRDRRRGSGRGARARPSGRRARHHGEGDRHARRGEGRRQGADARARRVRGRARGDDGAPDGPRRHGADAVPRGAGLRGALPRQDRARVGLPRARRQRG